LAHTYIHTHTHIYVPNGIANCAVVAMVMVTVIFSLEYKNAVS